VNKVLTKTLKVVMLFVAVFCASAVHAGDFEDGDAAYDKKNYAVAMAKYKQAAAQGLEEGQFGLGIMYDRGHGVRQDYAEAVKWWKLAAAQGHAFAQYHLGLKYKNGQSVVQDYVRAHMWFNLAGARIAELVFGRDEVARLMTTQQIAEAQKLARECQARDYKNCN